ncbi:dGTP triphosphohydrolase, partial [uncultured Slackia sp.]|uniref:dGTP triphosphohydrolase n=1 Tax=uncultured Slackia sp. TaxID=665903 RepID=UPI00262CD33B
MHIIRRENQVERERASLSQDATLSCETEGRARSAEPDFLRNEFQRDRDKIIHAKSFRRLSHKTQVFIAPEGDHFRTRLTHTLEVAQIARTIARALGLNEDLTEAVALGHDLGHTPFGHAGERAINELVSFGFYHFEQSKRVCEKLEKNGKGLNLTFEVLDGIERHTTGDFSKSLEGRIVRMADRIAYINHDIDDAIRGGIISSGDIPKEITEILGESKSQRISSLVNSVVTNSNSEIVMDS